jgi:catalase
MRSARTSEAQPLLDKAGVVTDKGVITSKKGASTDPFLNRAVMGRIWEREPSVRAVF